MSASDTILILIIILLVILLAVIPVLIRRTGNYRQRRKPRAFSGHEAGSVQRPDDLPGYSGNPNKRGRSGLEPDATSLEEKQDLEELVGGPARKNGRPH